MINFVTANDSKVELFAGNTLVAACSTISEIFDALVKFGFDGGYYSSSMDFATEEGFAYDSEAKEMFEIALANANNA